MTVIASTLSGIQLGLEQSHDGLVMIPLLGTGLAEPDYLLLDQALEQRTARVTEVSEAGSVPTLRFVNDAEQPVLLLDGEELIGAKQNRILNLSVLAPARTQLEIPVSCVEAGRWRQDSSEFRSAERTHYAEGRGRKAAQVSRTMHRVGSRQSDQIAVWDDIRDKSARFQARSGTGAAAAMYESRSEELAQYERAFRTVPGQLGVAFLLNGTVISLDLFDCEQTCAAVLPKLIQSCALDALDAKIAGHRQRRPSTADLFADDADAHGQPPQASSGETSAATAAPPITPLDAAGLFLNRLAAAPTRAFNALGLGDDLRLEGDEVAGGALSAQGRLVHLCAFPADQHELRGHSGERTRSSRIVRPSQRRRWLP
ncbi:MAG: DUF6569 family protein [Lamprobacter sp.]|uniref:ARPP-1 family domain-containing protein n=1 Tax=Lamprobacter sp. TaxID=3100796 RepID=UPI002B263350|nr:DUF6569 family protein [Lamprobacter sp.]MEA3641799.1 DUF6569 family protein [Lamprobacter sp.]